MKYCLYYEPLPHLEAIFPTTLWLIVGDKDFLVSPDLTAAVYAGAMEPKSLTILKGGHFDGFQGEDFKIVSTTAARPGSPIRSDNSSPRLRYQLNAA